ncbi:MAG: M48 family metallopeptidase, partial [Burkholderiales bacterium]
MQLDLPFLVAEPQTVDQPAPVVPSGEGLVIQFVRERRARKYIIRVKPDGSLRVTIPRGGSKREAEAFVATHRSWAEKERHRVAAQHAPAEWHAGTAILLHGEPTSLRVERDARGVVLIVGGERVRVPHGATNLRPAAEHALRQIAQRDLVPRLQARAASQDLTVTRVTIRDQRTRWGSCSRRGVIALNFRLVQMPPAVCEYVLLHELIHLRQPNHSRRYWRLVEEVCPDFRAAERWLRVEGRM